MKQRILTAIVGLAILFVVLALFNTVALNIVVSVIAVMALSELLAAAGCGNDLKVKLPTLVLGAAIPLFEAAWLAKVMPELCFLFVVLLFVILLYDHEALRIEQIAFVLFSTLVITGALRCIVALRDVFGHTAGLFGIFVVLVAGWLNDAAAYFCGMAFGKHKLAPNISPKKTIEGAVGGVLVSVLGQLLLGLIYTGVCAMLGISVSVQYLPLLLLAPVMGVLGILGDLSASVIKRQFGIKDFGDIMPGHGGILDRFDSVLMILPFVYLLFTYLPLIEVA